MTPNSVFSKILRWSGIVLMALTAGFTILGGAGTSCVALDAASFGAAMAPLANYQPLYIFYVLATTAIGVAGVRATVLLIKASPTSYRDALIVLVAGIIIGVIHIITSRAIRGKSQPVDMVVYTTVFTLVVFLLFRIPGIWEGIGYNKNASNGKTVGGAAAMLLGAMMLAIPYIAGPSHTWGGTNYANAFHASLTPLGWIFVAGGLLALVISQPGQIFLAQRASRRAE